MIVILVVIVIGARSSTNIAQRHLKTMTSRLTANQKMRFDREMLSSGVTVSSRETTRHRNAAEQTLLEQKLHDLDLQRRRSIQAIKSEQEKSVLKFLKTQENNGPRCGKSPSLPGKKNPRKSVQASRPVWTRCPVDCPPAQDTSSNQSSNTQNKTSTKNSSSTKVQEVTASIYDAYFSYTPSFLLEEYRKEEALAKAQFKTCSTEPSTENHSDELQKERSKNLTDIPDATSDHEFVPSRRRANSLQIFSERFPPDPTVLFSKVNPSDRITLDRCTDSQELFLERRHQLVQDATWDILSSKAQTKTVRHELFNDVTNREKSRTDPLVTEPHAESTSTFNKESIAHDFSEAEYGSNGKVSEFLTLVPSDDTDMRIYRERNSHTIRNAGSQSTKLISDRQVLETKYSPKKLSQNIPPASKSSLVSDWMKNPRDIHWAQPRRISICTDKLPYNNVGKCLEESSQAQWEELGSFMAEVRRKLYQESRINNSCSSSSNNYNNNSNNSNDIEDDGDKKEHSSPNRSMKDSSSIKEVKESPLLTRGGNVGFGGRKNSFESCSRTSSIDYSSTDKNMVHSDKFNSDTQCTQSRHKSMQEDDEKMCIQDSSRKNSILDATGSNSTKDMSRKSSIQDTSRKSSIQDTSRKNSIQNKSRKNSIQDTSRKNSIQNISRRKSTKDMSRESSFDGNHNKNSIEDISRRNSNHYPYETHYARKHSILGLRRKGKFENDTSESDTDGYKTLNIKEKNKIAENGNIDIHHTLDKHSNQENLVLHAEAGSGLLRDRKLFKKVLLEASARQLTSCLNKLAEEKGNDATDEQRPTFTPRLTPRSSIDDNQSQPAESEINCPRDVSFHALPVNIPTRRPSTKGNFFLIANALKSGQPLGKPNFRPGRQCRRSISNIPSDHPCALADYESRTTSVKRLADAHEMLQNSALCMVEKDSDIKNSGVFA